MDATAILPPLQSTSLRQSVTGRFLRSYFAGRFRPGQRLVVATLAKELHVSPTPVREGLVELAALGVVDLLPNRGAVVRPFGPRQLREIYHVRQVLEAEAARQACGRIPGEELAALAEQLDALLSRPAEQFSEQAVRLDEALHRLIGAHCGSDRLAEEIARYETLMQAVREVAGNRLQAQRRAAQEHRRIVQGLRDADADMAARLMTEHIRSTADAVAAILSADVDVAATST